MTNECSRIQTNVSVYIQIEESFGSCIDVGELYKVNQTVSQLNDYPPSLCCRI